MNVVSRSISVGLVSVGLLLSGTVAQAQEKVIRFGFQNQLDHPQGMGAQKFADLVSQKSGGKLTELVSAGLNCAEITLAFWPPLPR